ncbi:MAG TPA: SGNH/GDSL hydrolase family protein [Planctomycetota bacterium]|nr:SGNH/GDSL hydrolase family protein [Planctomycetota bacterium]
MDLPSPPPAASARRRRRFLLAAGGVLLALLVVEALLAREADAARERLVRDSGPFHFFTFRTADGRILSKHRGPFELVLDPVLDYRNQPGQRGPGYSINSRGYRGAELRPRETGVPRIVLLGGSAAFGFGIASDEDTLAARLGRELAPAEVVNAAVIGYVSGQELALLRSEALDLDPQVVIAFDGWNDFRTGVLRPDGTLATVLFAQVEDLASEAALARRDFAFAFRVAFSHVFRQIRTRVRQALSPVPEPYAPGFPTEAEVEGRLAPYLRNVLAMQAACRAKGCRFLLVVQSERKADPPYRAFAARATSALLEAGGEAIDAGTLEELSPAHYLDDVHLTAEGNAAVAKTIARRLR